MLCREIKVKTNDRENQKIKAELCKHYGLSRVQSVKVLRQCTVTLGSEGWSEKEYDFACALFWFCVIHNKSSIRFFSRLWGFVRIQTCWGSSPGTFTQYTNTQCCKGCCAPQSSLPLSSSASLVRLWLDLVILKVFSNPSNAINISSFLIHISEMFILYLKYDWCTSVIFFLNVQSVMDYF